ncbi:MAG: Trm112 family protein [Candidatus Omnitrophica bacterium]|nr:Trm112 family protein [Candidatus Omnitrophota bacterium]
MISPELLEILACPACKTKVVLKEDKIACTNPACGLLFPIRDGIPVMLIEEAIKP